MAPGVSSTTARNSLWNCVRLWYACRARSCVFAWESREFATIAERRSAVPGPSALFISLVPHLERIIDKNAASRLIVRTNLLRDLKHGRGRLFPFDDI